MMRAGWAATLLALLMALIGIVLGIGGAWLLILGGSIYYLIAGIGLLRFGMVSLPRTAARRLDLHRLVRPQRHLGLCGSRAATPGRWSRGWSRRW